MTGLPPPPNRKPKKKKKAGKKKKAKQKPPTADEVQAESATAEEVQEEATTIYHDKPETEAPPTVVAKKKMTNNVFSFLWQGTDLPGFSNDAYDLKYVELLANGVRKHVPNGQLTMLADEFYYEQMRGDRRFDSIRLEKFDGHGIGGWSNVLEGFRENLRPKMGKRHMLVGLDTVFMGNCQWLFDWNKSPVGLPLDPYNAPQPCDAVVTFDYEGAAFVWDAFEVAKTDGMKDYLLFDVPSEMMLLRYLYKRERWEPLEQQPSKLLSYKAHVLRGVNPWRHHTSVVYFHGKPKPHQLSHTNRIWQQWGKR
jgi:hypothetical protein